MKLKIKTLKIIHFALISGVTLAYFTAGTFSNLNIPKFNLENIKYLLIPVVAYLLGNFLFRNSIKNIDKNLKLQEKFAKYQSASLIRWAVIEGACFLLMFTLVEMQILGLFLLLYLLFLRPTENRIAKDLNVNYSELFV